MPDSNEDRRLLVVVDLVGDLGEAAWNVLYSTCKQLMASRSRSKIILTNRSDRIVKFGTTRPALRLSYVSSEAFWYFFKTITFGSTDPKMHPRLLHLAMDIAKTLNRSLIAANINAYQQDRPVQLGRMATPLEYDLVFFYEYQRSSQEEVPEMRFRDVMYGNVKASAGKVKLASSSGTHAYDPAQQQQVTVAMRGQLRQQQVVQVL
eukprot:XP_020404830.1 uncharacterized protein LOC109944462 [Zea mays]